MGANKNHYNYLVDTGRKLNVHKTFRRRPGRLLKGPAKWRVTVYEVIFGELGFLDSHTS